MAPTGVLNLALLRMTMMRLQSLHTCTKPSTTEDDYAEATDHPTHVLSLALLRMTMLRLQEHPTYVLSQALLEITMLRLQRPRPCTKPSTTEDDYAEATETTPMC